MTEVSEGTGDEPCQRCGNGNLVWWVESAQWNLAVPERSPILCPACFAVAWEKVTGREVIWELRLDPNSADLRKRSYDEIWDATIGKHMRMVADVMRENQ